MVAEAGEAVAIAAHSTHLEELVERMSQTKRSRFLLPSDGTRCCLQSGSNTSGTTHFLQLRFHITNRTLLCILTREDADSFYAQ